MSAGWNLDDIERLFENEKHRTCRDTSDCCPKILDHQRSDVFVAFGGGIKVFTKGHIR